MSSRASEIKLTNLRAHAIQLAVPPTYHFRRVLYCPNRASGEFLNIGLLLFGQAKNETSFEGALWLEDFAALRHFDPQADPQVIRGSCDELESRLRAGAPAEKLAAALPGAVQLSNPTTLNGREGQSPFAILQSLATLYLRAAPNAAAELERALQLLKAVTVLEGREKDMVEQALESALAALESPPAASECGDDEHCESREQSK